MEIDCTIYGTILNNNTFCIMQENSETVHESKLYSSVVGTHFITGYWITCR